MLILSPGRIVLSCSVLPRAAPVPSSPLSTDPATLSPDFFCTKRKWVKIIWQSHNLAVGLPNRRADIIITQGAPRAMQASPGHNASVQDRMVVEDVVEDGSLLTVEEEAQIRFI